MYPESEDGRRLSHVKDSSGKHCDMLPLYGTVNVLYDFPRPSIIASTAEAHACSIEQNHTLEAIKGCLVFIILGNTF
jgi:hypothetical protein